ncbi:nuclear transport factor 2 family protein [candidate division KSB1 bacterium]
MNNLESKIWQVVQAHNKAWTVLEDLDEQMKYVHDDIVFITPSDKYPIEGKDAYIESYENWINSAEVHFFKELDHKVRITGNGTSAIVTYNIDMSFLYNGEEAAFQGRDMMFLIFERGKWLIAADVYSPFPKEEGQNQ